MATRTRTLKNGRKVYDVLLRRPDGTQYSQTFHNRREAETWEAQQKADRSRHRWVDPTAGRLPFGEYAEEWLRNRTNLRPKTRELYEGQLRKHLLPAFGETMLVAITQRDVRTWHAGLTVRVSRVLAAKCYRLLASIMNTAVEDKLVPASPCSIKGAGKEGSPERPLLTIGQVFGLADAIDPRYRALVLLAAFCGLRLGELMGLTRADLDLLHRRVSVRRQLQEFGSGVEATAPKTDAGIRRVSIPASIVPDLERHLAQWAQPGVDGGLFPGPHGAFRRLTVYKAWHRALAKAGLAGDVHIHDLRHFANVMAARVPGTSTKDLMARMGHASVAAALRYQHVTEGAEPAISAGIDAAIKESRRDQGDEGGPLAVVG